MDYVNEISVLFNMLYRDIIKGKGTYHMRLSVITAIAILFLGLVSAYIPAKASEIVWEDSAHKVSLSYPDTWKMVNNAKPDDVITIAALSGEGQATCRIRVREDRRYVIYPPELSEAVQRVHFSKAFWAEYLTAEYRDPEMYIVRDGMGLGRGFATYTLADYTSDVPGGEIRRRGMIIASNYNGKLYIYECSAHHLAFDMWKHMFRSILKTVDFQKQYHELPSGNYRAFMEDGYVLFEDPENMIRIPY